VLYHLNFDPKTVVMGAVLLVLNILMLYHYRNKYKGILN
jgi:hypothetical protein